jgi:Ca2+-binding EF-hand superfamily protein
MLKDILETISEIEMIVEGQRQDLCRMRDFAPYSAFCRVDRNAGECIDSFAISQFLTDNGFQGRIGDCAKLVRFFDSDGDGILSYQDFIQMILPCDDNYMRAEVQRRPYSRVGRFDALPIEMEMGLVRVI